MRKGPLVLWLAAGCLCPAAAVEPAHVELEIQAPDSKATVPVNVLPGQLVVPSLTDPLTLPAAQLEPASGVDAGAPGVNPSANSASVNALLPGAESEPKAAAEMPAEAGQVQFDLAKPVSPNVVVVADAPGAANISLDDVVKRAGPRRLQGVFIQQEQEGNLLQSDLRDSSGNVFRYYRPIEMRPALMAEVHENQGALGKVGYGFRRSLNFWDKDPYKVWNAWSLPAKLSYLDKLEAAVVAEKGKQAAWSGKVSLILERSPDAPEFITKNPHTEDPPYMDAHRQLAGARFMLPEIVTDKDHPAATINEALNRTRTIIKETGHAGTQYHVFLKADPQRLADQLNELQSTLQLVNNVLFADAAAGNFINATLMALQPWHGGRSTRVADLLSAASPRAQASSGLDPDSEKHSFVGLRYWGLENGKIVLSFELRDASLPWKRRGTSSMIVGGVEGAAMPERDYSRVEYYLTFLSLYAEKLNAGRAPRLNEPSLRLDAKWADALIDARARQRGMPADAYYGIEAFAKRLSRVSSVPQGYLFPFAASAPDSPELNALIDEFLKQSARVRALDRDSGGFEEQRRSITYFFGSAYSQWAQSYEASARPRFEALFRASAVE